MMSSLICGLRFLHPSKANFPMLVTLSGILMLVSDSHPRNAEFPMLVTLSGMLILVSDLYPANALSPMFVTLSGTLYNSSSALYAMIVVLSALNKTWFSYINDFDSLDKEPSQPTYLQPIITQYFIDNKSEIWLLFLIAHSKR